MNKIYEGRTNQGLKVSNVFYGDDNDKFILLGKVMIYYGSEQKTLICDVYKQV